MLQRAIQDGEDMLSIIYGLQSLKNILLSYEIKKEDEKTIVILYAREDMQYMRSKGSVIGKAVDDDDMGEDLVRKVVQFELDALLKEDYLIEKHVKFE